MVSSSTRMSRRRARFSSSSISVSSFWLSRQKWWWVCQSPSTRACLMNSSRLSTGSIRPKFTLREVTSGMPYSVTFS